MVNDLFIMNPFIPKGANLLIPTDNTTAMAYLRGKGKLVHLMDVVEPMIKALWKAKITTCVHLPGVQNSEADTLSRTFRRDHDWCLSPEGFAAIENRWGKMSFDFFANDDNTVSETFAGCELRAQVLIYIS